MGRISSKGTFFYKRIFPAIWFGFLVVFAAIALINGVRDPMLLIVPAAMVGFGYFIMKRLVFDLVDEVYDRGNALLIRNRGEEESIALADITNVGYSPYMNPPRVTLSLRRAGRFGQQVTFCAPMRLMPMSTSPEIDKLIARVDAARRAVR